MLSLTRLLCTTALSLCVGSALAQTTKPGLWEIQNKVGGNPEIDQAMAQMQKQMASMPPAQRKMMEDMMAAQGVKMGKGGGMTVQVCITPEMAARQELPTQTEGDCTTQITSRSGNTLKISYACKNPPSSGEGTYTFRGDTGYDMKMKVTSSESGKPQTMAVEGQGRWLSSSCGNVRPIR